MLSLSDPRWREFSANYTDGSHVAELLARAEAGEESHGWYDELFQELCHQYTVSPSAYPAAPHLLRLAKNHPSTRKDVLILLGSCFASSEPSRATDIPPDLMDDWRAAAREAVPLIAELLAQPQPTELDLRYLMSSLAALQGFPRLASAIEALDDI